MQPSECIRRSESKFNELCELLCIQFDGNSEVSIGEEATSNEMKPLLNAINDLNINVELRFLFVKVLKILLRKGVNRAALGKSGVSLIVRSMNMVTTERHNLISAEICNLVLNAVYDGKNVQHLIDAEGILSLFKLLGTFHETVQASALGAIQGVCFVPLGRKHIRAFPQVNWIQF